MADEKLWQSLDISFARIMSPTRCMLGMLLYATYYQQDNEAGFTGTPMPAARTHSKLNYFSKKTATASTFGFQIL